MIQKMTNSEFTSERGVSLIELLVVLVILAILTTFALISLGNSTKSLERQNIAKSFKNSLERARFDSIKRRASVCENKSLVVITSATSFTLITDSNQNGTLEPDTEAHTTTFGAQDGVSILTYPVVIRFDQRGNASSGPCETETEVDTPTIFCTTPCTAENADASNSNMIFVSKTGTVAIMPGGSTAPVFNAPTVASLDLANQINPLLVVWDPAPLQTPVPIPSATPTSTPNTTAAPTSTPVTTPIPSPTVTSTPTSSATPTPSPTASPTPTATPRWCNLGEQPAVVHCICSPIQYLQAGSGKCRLL
jgi:prepilin-type N-terminal cleavage/methylation domain-containing protein